MFVVILCLVFVAIGCAREDEESVSEKRTGPRLRLKRFTGEVTNVDGVAQTITVRCPTAEETFDVSLVARAEKIETGKRITVSYSEQAGKKLAKTVKAAKQKKVSEKDKRGDTAELSETPSPE